METRYILLAALVLPIGNALAQPSMAAGVVSSFLLPVLELSERPVWKATATPGLGSQASASFSLGTTSISVGLYFDN